MKTSPLNHQRDGLDAMDGKRNFALLAEQGTGKTWMSIADIERCFTLDKIDGVCIVAPNGVHINWTRIEIPKHMSLEAITYTWRGTPTTKKAKAGYERLYVTTAERTLRVLAINIEAINTKNGYNAVEEFLNSGRMMMIMDESTRIKNPTAKRTKKAWALGRLAIARRILSGTPLTRAPSDLYAQFHFLKPGLLGTTSYRAFVAEFSVLLGPDDPKMIAVMKKLAELGSKAGPPQLVARDENNQPIYRNLEKLSHLIQPHSFRVRKADCLDLPPKVYKRVFFDLTPPQRAIYAELAEEYHYEHIDQTDFSFQAIAARTKLKQVTSGFINLKGEPHLLHPDDNPRMTAFKELIEDIDGQFIVWAMFEEEMLQIKAALDAAEIPSALYYGKTKADERIEIIDAFQSGRLRGFVGHAAAAGIGITLTAAQTAIYYSCSYDNELRMQSEDRCHRVGTRHSVLYIDLIAEGTLDEDIMSSLSMKSAVASYVIDNDRTSLPNQIPG